MYNLNKEANEQFLLEACKKYKYCFIFFDLKILLCVIYVAGFDT